MICAVLGALSNVAVAWLCLNVSNTGGHQGAQGRVETRYGVGVVTLSRRPGVEHDSLELEEFSHPSVGVFSSAEEGPSELSKIAERLLDAAGEPTSSMGRMRVGLPFKSLTSISSQTWPGNQRTDRGVWRAPWPIVEGGNRLILLFPYHVHPIEFLLNTMIYGCVWLVILAWAARWRMAERPLSPRSVMLFACIAMLVGAIMTIAIAWYFALSGMINPQYTRQQGNRPTKSVIESTLDEESWRNRRWGIWRMGRWEGRGSIRVVSAWGPYHTMSAANNFIFLIEEDVDAVSTAEFPNIIPFLKPPEESIGLLSNDQRYPDWVPVRMARASGWPMVAMWSGEVLPLEPENQEAATLRGYGLTPTAPARRLESSGVDSSLIPRCTH